MTNTVDRYNCNTRSVIIFDKEAKLKMFVFIQERPGFLARKKDIDAYREAEQARAEQQQVETEEPRQDKGFLVLLLIYTIFYFGYFQFLYLHLPQVCSV